MNANESLLELLDREDLKIASFLKRVIAYFIDVFIVSVLVVIILYTKISAATSEAALLGVIQNFLGGLLLLQFSYHALFGYLYGASLGKMAMKIKIISTKTLDKPSILQALIRAGVREISDRVFMLGFAWALSNPLLKTWEDLAAKTVVIDLA